MIGYKFMQHMVEHSLSYGTLEEFEFRKALFAEVDARIEAHNASGASWTMGHNHLSTYTEAEYNKMLGWKDIAVNGGEYFEANENEAVPNSVNWVEAGAVTPVKDQGQCGSCWAFSSTGAMEGAHQIKSGELLSFSEQELVDCVKLSLGCNGGNQATAFNYLKQHYAEGESSYPYTAKTGTCAYNSSKATAVDTVGFTTVKADDVTSMKAALAKQPLSVSIEADKAVFQSYTSGVLNSTKCGTQLDHAVLAVGGGSASRSPQRRRGRSPSRSPPRKRQESRSRSRGGYRGRGGGGGGGGRGGGGGGSGSATDCAAWGTDGVIVDLKPSGFGFIRPNTGKVDDKDLYFHCSALNKNYSFDELRRDDEVAYDVVIDDRKGTAIAKNIEVRSGGGDRGGGGGGGGRSRRDDSRGRDDSRDRRRR